MKGNYDAKFLKASDFACLRNVTLTLCLRPNNCKLFLQSLPVAMFLLNLQQDLASLALLHCFSFNMFVIFFDPSPMLIVNQSFLS